MSEPVVKGVMAYVDRLEAQRDQTFEQLLKVEAELEAVKKERDQWHARCASLVMNLPPETVAGDVQRWADEFHNLLFQLRRERDELATWKRASIQVESMWNPQTVGKLLGMTLGDSIHQNIEPKIRELIAERDALKAKL